MHACALSLNLQELDMRNLKANEIDAVSGGTPPKVVLEEVVVIGNNGSASAQDIQRWRDMCNTVAVQEAVVGAAEGAIIAATLTKNPTTMAVSAVAAGAYVGLAARSNCNKLVDTQIQIE
jgi:hypothetical protein